ncbi:transglycosylase SLT domain-containing protein [Burkholderiaceae bacterium DAT-1]|nr:transglycosylase SLT domain-containing protein [Burkholderiaceae bacterium DAT-1]
MSRTALGLTCWLALAAASYAHAADAAPALNAPAIAQPLQTPSGQFSVAQHEAELAARKAAPDLWMRMRMGFSIPEASASKVREAERFYARHPKFLIGVIERSRPFLYFLVDEVERRGMPSDLALLPFIESAFNANAVSYASASGMWQFMPETGSRYGLERTFWYDGRRDVLAATYAALDYLQDLYNQFGDWPKSLAAYNWGEGHVQKNVERARIAGKDDSYDAMNKPNQTADYVPRLLAIRNIVLHPEQFGINLPDMPNKPYFESVTIKKHIDVDRIAELAGTTVAEIVKLNPGLVRPVFPYNETFDRKLLLPAEKAQAFLDKLAGYDKPLLTWQAYDTKPGESWADIAKRYNMSVDELKTINRIGKDRAASGQHILVRLQGAADAGERKSLADVLRSGLLNTSNAAPAKETAPASKPAPVRTHTVVKGDTLLSIAKKYGVPVAELKAANGLKSNAVAKGAVLKVPAGEVAKGDGKSKPAKAAASTRKHGRHR